MSRESAELAHELGMPLQVIYSCAELIRMELADDTLPAAQYAGMLMDGVDQVKHLLFDAMNREKAGVRLQNTDLVRQLKAICREYQPCAHMLGVQLRCGGNAAALNLALDVDRLARVVMNLLSNALRFTPRGGAVSLSWRALGDFVEIAVRDSGPGIAPERLPRLFLRGETDGGHGYGLPIARECARQMGGLLTCRSRPGQGSTFVLRLPVRGLEE